MRLFVAVDLDEPARLAVARQQGRLRTLVPGAALRWVRPELLHITVAFLGEVDEARLDAITAAFGRPIGQPPFEMRLGGLGIFPPRGAPRALWIGSQASEDVRGRGSPAARLSDLRSEIVSRLARTGLQLDSRSFSPHLTIARWKTPRSGERKRFLAIRLPDPVACLSVDHATLYESRLSTYIERARVNVTLT